MVSIQNTIGERLKSIRIQLNLNQKQIAQRLKITPAYWSALEQENRELTGNIIRGLINEFDISADWLLTGNKKMFLNSSDPNTTDFEKRTNAYYLSIVEIIELIEKAVGTNSKFEDYLKEIAEFINVTRNSPRATKNSNFERLSIALSEDFRELVHEYFLMNRSERTRQLMSETFNPSRHFRKVKLA